MTPIKKQPSTRINKKLREMNIATRRESDTLITSGRVFVNGKLATLGMQIQQDDKIEIRGKKKTCRYFAYHKPIGVVTTGAQNGEVDIIHRTKFPIKVFPIGRLDKDSSGLIIMTNDGRITETLLSPEKVHEKEYIVTVDRMLPKNFKERMEGGVVVPKTMSGKVGYQTKPCAVRVIGEKKFSITITEGKHRQIRRMCEALGITVMTLTRIRIGNILLEKLKPGEWREIVSVV